MMVGGIRSNYTEHAEQRKVKAAPTQPAQHARLQPMKVAARPAKGAFAFAAASDTVSATNASTSKTNYDNQAISKSVKHAAQSFTSSIPAKRKDSPERADVMQKRSTNVYKRPTSATNVILQTKTHSSGASDTSYAAAASFSDTTSACAARDDSGFANGGFHDAKALEIGEKLAAAKARNVIWRGYLKDMGKFGKCEVSLSVEEISEVVDEQQAEILRLEAAFTAAQSQTAFVLPSELTSHVPLQHPNSQPVLVREIAARGALREPELHRLKPVSRASGRIQDIDPDPADAALDESLDLEGFEQHLYVDPPHPLPAPAARFVVPHIPAPAKQMPGARLKPILALQTQEEYPWSRDVRKALTTRFNLEDFRINQLEAINATLSGKDVFVLMPTGGGKSICYQLPAVLSSGKTRGVTVVVSPLLSLMVDQVMSLLRRDIPAAALKGDLTAERRNFIFDELRLHEPRTKLLYVTPEGLAQSGALRNALLQLNARQKLARIVIDEAHCLSSWGADFRPDYRKLSSLRQDFPDIPLMALTATANCKAVDDIVDCLGMQGCLKLQQSFNRPNLRYEVRQKTTKSVEQIASYIKTNHNGQCGIVYCLSKRACEEIAKDLRDNHDIKADFYHAGLAADDRTRVQKLWQDGQLHVICATIAFGMGIDKADVRYVVHQSMPKSLEGYYQETGRAGRDGGPAHCVLFFAYSDAKGLRHMVDKECSPQEKDKEYQLIKNVVSYCINISECRRTLVLKYFDDLFDAKACDMTCDNCEKLARYGCTELDVTHHVQTLFGIASNIQQKREKIAMGQLKQVFIGANDKKNRDKGWDQLPGFGRGQDMRKYPDAIDRLITKMLCDGYLFEEETRGPYGTLSHIKPRRKPLENSRIKLMVSNAPREPGPNKARTQKSALQKVQLQNFPSKRQRAEINDRSTLRKARVAPPRKRNKADENNDDIDFVPNEEVSSEEVDADNSEPTIAPISVDSDEDDDIEFEMPVKVKEEMMATQRPLRRAPAASHTTGNDTVSSSSSEQSWNERLYAELKKRLQQLTVDDEDFKIDDDLDTILQLIAMACPTAMKEFMDIEGFSEELYDLCGKPFKLITQRYALDHMHGEHDTSKAGKAKKASAPSTRQSSVHSVTSGCLKPSHNKSLANKVADAAKDRFSKFVSSQQAVTSRRIVTRPRNVGVQAMPLNRR